MNEVLDSARTCSSSTSITQSLDHEDEDLKGDRKKELLHINDDESCPICLDELDEQKTKLSLLTLDCMHIFHAKCIINWCEEKQSPTCPICRKQIPDIFPNPLTANIRSGCHGWTKKNHCFEERPVQRPLQRSVQSSVQRLAVSVEECVIL